MPSANKVRIFPEFRISRKKKCLESSKSHLIQIDVQPFQIFKTMRSMFYVRQEAGNMQLIQMFSEQLYSPEVYIKNILVSRDKDAPAFL